MKAEELYQILVEAGIAEESIHLLDTEYEAFSKESLLTAFAPAFERLKGSFGRNEYLPNIWDCDKFALLAHWYAQYLNVENQGTAGIAFGTFTYQDNLVGPHQINIAISDGNNIMFFEPQDSSFKELTQEEIASCVNLNM